MEWSLRTGIVLTPDRRSHAGVARIEAISRATRSAPVDPARQSDLRERSEVTPDARRVTQADVLRFQDALLGPSAASWVHGRSQGTPSAETGAALQPAHEPAEQVLAAAPPADRIAATLAHLRQLRGL